MDAGHGSPIARSPNGYSLPTPMPLLRAMVDRLRRRWSIRRQTVAGPLIDAFRVWGVMRRITSRRTARVLGPIEFASYLRQMTAWPDFRETTVDQRFDRIIIRQDGLSALDQGMIESLADGFVCIYANPAYALFGPRGSAAESSAQTAAVAGRLAVLRTASLHHATLTVRHHDGRVALVTTFNRCAALRRSLPQIAALEVPVLVVDDGSTAAQARRNRAIADACGARYLHLPDNRGLAAALNVGIAYLLADERAQWISYFQDDVDVDPALLIRLAAVEHEHDRPLLTGYDADEHPADREEAIAGERVKLKRLAPAVHLHAHAGYWQRVLPIPTQYLGAPKPRWEPSLEDYWIVKDAPHSMARRGLLIPCLPGLVRTFLWHAADSTWGNPNRADPPLRARDAHGR